MHAPVGPVTTRRTFFKQGAIAIGSLCGGCSIFLVKNKPDHTYAQGASRIELPITDYPGLKQPGGMVRITSDDGNERILVLRKEDGTLVALSMTCTHWGSDVNYQGDSKQLVCPSHGSRFDLQGAVVEGPADAPLKRYTVQESERVIAIDLV